MTDDARSFDAFFVTHHDQVQRTVAVAIGDPERARDVTQEAFAQAYRRWRRVRVLDRPVAWVYVVALNRARRDLGREARRPDPPIGPSEADPTEIIVAELTVHAALGGLAPRQRAAIVLRYLADLPVADVADAMGCSVGTAKATIHQALARLRVALADDDLVDDLADPEESYVHR